MKISKDLAQNIVKNIKEIINQELNFIDTDGIVVASTDQKRIGNRHAGAIEVMRRKENIIINCDNEFQGSKKGINIPIYFDIEIIGVIGITGEPKDVIKYGELLKKMTELLIKDAYLKDVSYKSIENERIIIENLLFNIDEYDFQKLNKEDIINFDITIPRRVVIADLSCNTIDKTLLYNFIHSTFQDKAQNLFLVKNNKITMLLKADEKINLNNYLTNLINKLKSNFKIAVIIGVGTIFENEKGGARSSFNHAEEALRWSNTFSHNQIQYYEDLDIGIVLMQTPDEIQSIYVKKILSSLTYSEIMEFYKILKVYEKNNASIKSTADELFIHKNTLQYKLNKLYEKTGYNPRNLNDYVILKLAFMMYEKFENTTSIN